MRFGAINRARSVLAGILTIAILTSCAGGDDESATTSAPPPAETTTPAPPTTTTQPATTTTSEPATTSTVDEMELAGFAYFTITSEYNALVDATNADLARSSSLATLQDVCARMAPATESFAQQIDATTWPADAADEADALVAAAVAGAGHYYACARAPGEAVAVDAYNLAISLGGEEASAMRFALGLPIDR